VTEKQIKKSREHLESLLAEMLAPLGRSERRHWGGIYVRGLLLNGERKSVGAMAARLPEANEQNLQQFVSQSPWPWEPVWERMAHRVERAFPTPLAWVIDDTGFPKKGQHSVGVARQYSGTLGKVGNCQVATSLHRTDSRGSSPLGFRLYLPEEWTGNRQRRTLVGVPEEIGFQEKWRLALELVDQARRWNLTPPEAVLADAGYGDTTEFRDGLAERGLPYAVGISHTLVVWPEPPRSGVPAGPGRGRPPEGVRYGEQRPVSGKELALRNQKRFRPVNWREGSKGQMVSRFWAARVQPAQGWSHGRRPGQEVWLLAEWPQEDQEPAKYYLCDLPKSLSLRQLVATARGRWRVEQDYQQLKEELGLDHFEGRSWAGWYHHVTLVMLAHLFLRLEQKRRGSNKRRGRCLKPGVSCSSCSVPGAGTASTVARGLAVHRYLTK
jgi:SRSO17 transposase